MRPDMWRWKHTMRDLATGFHIMRKRPEDHERGFTAWWPRNFLGKTSYGPGFREYLYLSTNTHTCTWAHVHTHTHTHSCVDVILLFSADTGCSVGRHRHFPGLRANFITSYSMLGSCSAKISLTSAKPGKYNSKDIVSPWVCFRSEGLRCISPRRTQISPTDPWQHPLTRELCAAPTLFPSEKGILRKAASGTTAACQHTPALLASPFLTLLLCSQRP